MLSWDAIVQKNSDTWNPITFTPRPLIQKPQQLFVCAQVCLRNTDYRDGAQSQESRIKPTATWTCSPPEPNLIHAEWNSLLFVLRCKRAAVSLSGGVQSVLQSLWHQGASVFLVQHSQVCVAPPSTSSFAFLLFLLTLAMQLQFHLCIISFRNNKKQYHHRVSVNLVIFTVLGKLRDFTVLLLRLFPHKTP